MLKIKKDKNYIVLFPRLIYLDILDIIFQIIYSNYNKKNIFIETDKYIYKDFQELTRSPEDIAYGLKIYSDNNEFEINFSNIINIKFKNKTNKSYGIALKIRNLILKKCKRKSTLLYIFNKYFWQIYGLIAFIIYLISNRIPILSDY